MISLTVEDFGFVSTPEQRERHRENLREIAQNPEYCEAIRRAALRGSKDIYRHRDEYDEA